ncbi:hypothetical protein SAMN04487939_11721 [Lysobacter sp. yr284]|uniref:hypothetical protein n=1 Tax=Lysobacter sp. yr284 TaxID=1761791 RepID=UPI00089544C5|nr:hypothetical protein [Lysobacter sp. yr284]SDZ12791.1 hypothetical protein SAMN04487939_11721 [Lysobacter sp. yr284]
MEVSKMLIAAGFAAALSLAAVAPARAGDLSGAQLTCYVDTFAFDVPQAQWCHSTWTPGTATNPSVAMFEVTGLAAGSYSFAWTDLETGQAPAGCGNAQYCIVPIATETRGDGEARARVVVTDTATGAQRSLDATAWYWDGYN